MSNIINQIINIFDQFAKRKIPFIALRGYEFLLNRKPPLPNDIDLLIPLSALNRVKEIFIKCGYFSTKSPGHIGFGKIIGDHKVAFDFQIDFIREKNIPYLNFQSARKDVSFANGIPILCGEKLAFHLIIHSLLGRSFFLNDYKQKILEIYKTKEPDLLNSLLQEIFTKKISGTVIRKIKEKKFSDLENKKFRFLIFVFIKNPRLLLKFISYIRYRMIKKFRFGKVISFIGLDGSGKTTIANMLVDELKKNGFKAKYKYMGRKKNHFLPMHKVSKIVGVSKIQKKKEPSKLYLTTRELIYSLDLLMRYCFTILPRILTGTNIVCDRYAYDLFLDKYFGFCSYILLRFFYPRPSMLFFLDVDEEEIINRKNEYSRKTRQHFLHRLMEVEKLFGGRRIISKKKQETLACVYKLTLSSILK